MQCITKIKMRKIFWANINHSIQSARGFCYKLIRVPYLLVTFYISKFLFFFLMLSNNKIVECEN